jgi:uncharacterized protein (TIGR04255 family)
VQELAKKPLVEAIFELRWKLERTADPANARDPGFKILFGRFFDQVRNKYPAVIDLPSSIMPEEMVPHVVRHQFRTGPDTWPLLQLGPGILTVNDTAGYTWPGFKENLVHALSATFDSYPQDLYIFQPTQVVLRYINSIPVDPAKDKVIDYLKQKLHTTICIAPTLAETVNSLDQPSGLNLSLAFPMISPSGVCGLSFSTGLAGDEPALIWQLDAQASGDDVPLNQHALAQWLDAAHGVIETWFERLSDGELLTSFKG